MTFYVYITVDLWIATFTILQTVQSFAITNIIYQPYSNYILKYFSANRENLVYNNENVPDEVLIRACKACGIYHFVEALLEGFDTVLGENVTISAGQKQLFTIARAMIQNRPMLILDEATSSVDTRTEAITQKAMDRLMQNRTSFVIAHRLSTIRNADLILVLKDGDIIEQGTHEELLKLNGFYADLYNSQFEQ